VFRYALERWPSDRYEAVVTHSWDLSDDEETVVEAWEKAVGSGLNLTFMRHDARQSAEPGFTERWVLPATGRPWLMLQSPSTWRRQVMIHTGPLGPGLLNEIVDSPARRELVRRLLAGDSVVWLVVGDQGDAATQSVIESLSSDLERLGDELPLPDGIDLPGSEVYSDVPLTLRFSVLPVDRGDARESHLCQLAQWLRPDDMSQPLVIPVFGRGRALEVIPAETLDTPLIEDISRYLSGPCSCQVKEQNPGFDLLLAVDWEARLFGEFLPPPAGKGEAPAAAGTLATLVTIPPGATANPQAPHVASTTPTANQDVRVNPLGVILFAMAACAVLWTISTRRGAPGGSDFPSAKGDETS
jgi:hypothetical protein